MESLPSRSANRFPNAGTSYTDDSSYLDGSYGESLRQAVERLYTAFADCHLSVPLRGCPHCFTDADLDYLRTTPLRSLTHGDLYVVATKLITTLGEPSDAGYFAPRILEALAEGAYIELESVADRLSQIPVTSWNPERRQALYEYFSVLFEAIEGTWAYLGDENRRTYVRKALPSIFSVSGEQA